VGVQAPGHPSILKPPSLLAGERKRSASTRRDASMEPPRKRGVSVAVEGMQRLRTTSTVQGRGGTLLQPDASMGNVRHDSTRCAELRQDL